MPVVRGDRMAQRVDPVQRQIGIGGGDGVAERCRERQRISPRPRHDAHEAARALGERDVDAFRLLVLHARHVQVRGHADDRGRLAGCLGAETDPVPDRAAARPVALCEAAVHDRDPQSARDVLGREGAAFEHAQADGLEEAWRDGGEAGGGHVRRVLVGDAVDRERRRARAEPRQAVHERDRRDTRNRGEPGQQSLEESHLIRRRGVVCLGEADARDQHVMRRESDVQRLEFEHAARHESGAH